MYQVLVAGGDMRFVYLAECLKENNLKVSMCGFDDNTMLCDGIEIVSGSDISDLSAQSDIIVLPLPISHNNIMLNTPLSSDSVLLSDILSYAKKDAVVTGGRVITQLSEQFNLNILDYSQRDDFAYLNAVPTAEGAISMLMQKSDKALCDMKIAVTGFGKCGEILAAKLSGLSKNILVFARSAKDISHSSALGFDSFRLSELKKHIGDIDVIFNTIPFPFFESELLSVIKDSCKIIDIASAPGCIADDSYKELLDYILYPAIPGRYSPRTASKILNDVILTIMRESGKDAYECL